MSKRHYRKDRVNTLGLMMGVGILGTTLMLTLLLLVTSSPVPQVGRTLVEDDKRIPAQFEMAMQMAAMHEEPGDQMPAWLIILTCLVLAVLILWRGQLALKVASSCLRTLKGNRRQKQGLDGALPSRAPVTMKDHENGRSRSPQTLQDIDWI